MVDYRKHLEAAKQKALNWTPQIVRTACAIEPECDWRVGMTAAIGIYDDAIHAAECEGCAVKASAYMEIAPTEGYPHDDLPFHNVFNVGEGSSAIESSLRQRIASLEDRIDHQNDILQMLQSQRDAYKTRLDALMNDGLLVDKTNYRLEFADETEDEVRLRLIPIDHAA